MTIKYRKQDNYGLNSLFFRYFRRLFSFSNKIFVTNKPLNLYKDFKEGFKGRTFQLIYRLMSVKAPKLSRFLTTLTICSNQSVGR